MNRFDVIEAMAKRADTTEANAFLFLNAMTDIIKEEIKAEREVRLFGFGTFECRKRAASENYDPDTGKMRKVPGHKLPAFKAGVSFKKIVE